MLLRLLRLKFGPLSSAIEAEVRAGSTTQLEDWTRRFVEATRLAEIFD